MPCKVTNLFLTNPNLIYGIYIINRKTATFLWHSLKQFQRHHDNAFISKSEEVSTVKKHLQNTDQTKPLN